MSFARRIVIDTGVLVSAAIRPDSVPALAVEKALLYFEVCASNETWAELETVLLRPKFDPYAALEARRGFLDGLRSRLSTYHRRHADCDGLPGSEGQQVSSSGRHVRRRTDHRERSPPYQYAPLRRSHRALLGPPFSGPKWPV